MYFIQFYSCQICMKRLAKEVQRKRKIQQNIKVYNVPSCDRRGKRFGKFTKGRRSLSLRQFEDSYKSDKRYQLAVAHRKLTFICLFLFCTLQ